MSTATRNRLARLEQVIAAISPRIIACSGGIDSMLLATVAHRGEPGATTVAHAISPAVPAAATSRVQAWAQREGWRLEIVRSGEFDSEDYLSNPVNRCYYCKSKLYDSLDRIARAIGAESTLMSGANTDDLGEYRPGLNAAQEHAVRPPISRPASTRRPYAPSRDSCHYPSRHCRPRPVSPVASTPEPGLRRRGCAPSRRVKSRSGMRRASRWCAAGSAKTRCI
jgi:hypothetical protein